MKPCCLLWTNSDIRVILIKKTMISLVYTACKSSMQWKQIQSFIKEWFINKATWATTRLGGLLPPPSPPSVLYPFVVGFVPTASSGVVCWEGLWLWSCSVPLSWGSVPIHEATAWYDAAVRMVTVPSCAFPSGPASNPETQSINTRNNQNEKESTTSSVKYCAKTP